MLIKNLRQIWQWFRKSNNNFQRKDNFIQDENVARSFKHSKIFLLNKGKIDFIKVLEYFNNQNEEENENFEIRIHRNFFFLFSMFSQSLLFLIIITITFFLITYKKVGSNLCNGLSWNSGRKVRSSPPTTLGFNGPVRHSKLFQAPDLQPYVSELWDLLEKFIKFAYEKVCSNKSVTKNGFHRSMTSKWLIVYRFLLQ